MNKEELNSWKKVLEDDLEFIVEDIHKYLVTPAFVFLKGEMGAGKTTFVKKFLRDFQVSSPTYSVLNDYGPVTHGDFYRLESSDELINLDLELYFEDREYFFSEWGDKFLIELFGHIPDDWNIFELEIKVSSHSKSNNQNATRELFLNKIDRV